MTLDRINPDGNYSPENCRWVNMEFQANNRTSNRTVLYKNKEYTVAQFAKELGIQYYTVINQLRLGWTIEKIADKARSNNGGH